MAKKTSKKSSTKKTAEWPGKKNVLFRPDRSGYVRKDKRQDECVFCVAEAGPLSFETLTVYKSKHAMVILNKYPYNSGHLLVLPRRHCGDFLALSDEEHSDLQKTLRMAFAATQEIYEPAAINMGMNHGKAAGAGLPDHLHYHIIPRWAGDLNFFPLVAETKVVVESLEQTYKRYLEFFKKNYGASK